MRRAIAVALALLFLASCGGGDGDGAATRSVTVAFLRAVGGAPSTEPEFLRELRRGGFRVGQNLTVLAADPDEAYPDPADAAAIARRWQEQGVDLIVALSSSGARAAAHSAPDTNILFLSNDPTATGLVADETSPGARSTGATFRVPADRTLALAARIVPGLRRIGLAYPPADPAAIANRDAVRAAADELRIELVTAEFDGPADAERAVDELADEGVQALVLSTSPAAARALSETGAAAERLGIPVVANTSLADFAVVSLSPDTEELGRQLGRQATRLLTGATPDLVPVEDPNRFILTINAGVARRMGIRLPDDLLREATVVVP